MKDSWQPDNTKQAQEQESKGAEENNQPGELGLFSLAFLLEYPWIFLLGENNQLDELELSSETETLPEEVRKQESQESIPHKRRSRSGTNYDFEPYITRKIYGETLTTIFIYTTFSAAIFTVSILVGKFLLFPVSPVNQSTYPTSIPWIKSQIQCEDTGRNWSNNQCWDEEHSASF